MCLLLETVKLVNGEFINASYHEERMAFSSNSIHGVMLKPHLNKIQIPKQFSQGIVKCRIIYSSVIEEIGFENYAPKKINSLKLVFDDSISYPFKYADRSALLKLLEQKGPADEIIIVKNGLLTDTSFSNISFRKGNNYYTPGTYLLNGTKRQHLLEKGIIREVEISVPRMREMDEIILINAMLDMENGIKVDISSILS